MELERSQDLGAGAKQAAETERDYRDRFLLRTPTRRAAQNRKQSADVGVESVSEHTALPYLFR